MEYREGQTATNPKTGQKVVYQGGMWVAVQGQDKSKLVSPVERSSLDQAQKDAQNAIGVLGDLTRFQDVNTSTPTGGLGGLPIIRDIREKFDPNVQQLAEITARIAPAQRQPGSGTTSDRDLALFLQASPGVTRNKTSNDAIVERGRGEAVRRQQYADFLDKYARENGTLNGAEAAFRGQIGLGTLQNPYSAKAAGDRSSLPRGAHYESLEGIRRNDNGPRGNPIIEATKPRPVDKYRQKPASASGVIRYDAQGNPT